ncbi:hypothetical protein NC653_003086 [Populus alba x Populus x berolinensis]|uniref:Thioredoxin-like protein 4B n=1 Tax=Populus alba x Populus x berolinensis TaxID=444605 RepID=A0AAD6RRQ2_9ROSI|nr:hypothetical protein NC653_003086 [Populus alba x Populus x berolinensis]
MSDYLLTTLLTKKKEIDYIIRDTIDKVLVLRFGRASDPVCLHLDDILSKSAREVSKFATVALVDIDSEDVQVYVNYFDITLVPSTVFFFNAHHMKMDSGTADHTKWVGAFHRKQDFIDVVERILLINLKEFPTLFTSPLILMLPIHPKEAVDQIPREIKKVDVSSAGASAAFLLSVLAIFRAAMKGKLIANCPLPPERIPRYELLYKNL